MTVKLKRAALLLEGGPLDGRGFYLDDFEMLRDAERTMGRPALDGYHPDLTHGRVRMEIHPQTGGSRGGQLSQRWVWDGRRRDHQVGSGAAAPVVPTVTGHADLPRCTPTGIPPEGDSTLRRVYEVILAGDVFGADLDELARAVGWGPVQVAPLAGVLVLGGAVRRDDDRFVALEVE